MNAQGRSEAGFTLVEMLLTVVVVGVAFAIVVGGVGTALITSDYHRKQATVQASLRNVAESLKGTTGAAAYKPCASTSDYAGALLPTRTSDGSTASSATQHSAPSVTPSLATSQLLVFYALATGATFVPPARTTERWDIVSTGGNAANRVSAEFADEALTSATATGTRVATSSQAGNSTSQALLLEGAGAIVRHGTATATSGGATTLAITKPPGTQFGDAMIAHIAVRGGTATTVTHPVGWSLVTSFDNGASVKSIIYQRTESDVTASSFTWTFGTSVEAVGGIVSYGGVNDYVANITAVSHWSEADGDFEHDPCPTVDDGLQLISVSVTATSRRDTAAVEIVKRRP